MMNRRHFLTMLCAAPLATVGPTASARYRACVARALYYNAMARTVEGLSGGIFQKPPLLDLVDANLANYRTTADITRGTHFAALPTPSDVTFRTMSAEQFADETVREMRIQWLEREAWRRRTPGSDRLFQFFLKGRGRC